MLLKSTLITKKTVSSLNIILGMALVLSILLLARDVVSHYIAKETTSKKKPAASGGNINSRQRMQLFDYSQLMKNNPFGFAGGEIKPLIASSDSKVKQMDIVLLGTVVGPQKLSYAIFRNSSGMQEVFRIGESVFGLGKLYMVKNDKAVIREGERITEVHFEDLRVKEVKKQGPGGTVSGPQFAQKTGRASYVVDQAKLQQAISNPGQMMTDARLRPNVMNGKEEGFVLSEVKPGGIYSSLGLQDGDVLLRINEYDISNPERALQAFTALRGLERVQIDMIRSGARMTMTYQIK